MIQRLLILSDPPVAPGYLPRLRYLCQYLHDAGYIVHLCTEQHSDLPFEHAYPITTISTYSGTTLDWLTKAIWSLLTNWREHHFQKAVDRATRDEHFDAIICSTFSTFPLGAAVRIAKQRHLPLIADIRDVDEQVDHSTYQYAHQQWWLRPFIGLYRTIQIHRRNRYLRQADTLTTISPWHVDFLRSFNQNVHLIYNGFDPEQFFFEAIPTPSFRITYIGSIFDYHNMNPLHEAIRVLNIPDIVLDIHTPQHNPVAYTEIGNTIRQSSIMLVLTGKHTHGMMTTKFTEALGCEKPILCIPDDEGCLSEAIQKTNAGIATDDIETIKAFIKDKYQEWKQQGYTHQPNQQKDMFNRLIIAHDFEDLLHHSTHL